MLTRKGPISLPHILIAICVLLGSGPLFAENIALVYTGSSFFNSGTVKVDIAGGKAETPLRTLHALAGLSFSF